MSVLEEMMAVLIDDEEALIHYGIKRRSGRYPWGSGEDPYQHDRDFLGRVEELKKNGWEETPENIKEEFGLTTTQYRIEKKICKDERRMQNIARAKSLRDDGLNTSEIGRQMGVNESTVRSWFNEDSERKTSAAKNTAEFLKEQVKKKGMIDVGTGVERELNCSKEQLNTALYLLEREGYPVYKGGIPQATNPGQQTNQKVLCPPGTEHKEIYQYDKIHTVKDYITRDGGDTYEKKFNYPESMDSKRLKIRYAEDGGIDRDGLVEIRRGVPDLSLGNSHHSQVRILVDGDHYIKGMAVYGDDKDFPPGVDVIFNTNKSKSKAKLEVLKEVKRDKDGNIDRDNPFGSLIKDADQGGQYWYTDKNGKKKLGLINKRADEGDWDDWKDALPAQFLSKQSQSMAKKQLDLAKADKYAEYDDICALTNPTIKKHLLKKFADNCDSAAESLQAAALPGQKYHVIIPINTMRDNEIYAPKYENGTKLALVRFPHGGTFEIPILNVNNKQSDAKKLIGPDSLDAVGINKKVADRLSGADFDGDTVMCIPTHDKAGRVKIASTPPLKGLEGFDPKMAYPERPGMKYMKDPKTGKDATQSEMGMISNLITDMTLAGASQDELARAVRHSMVVIDAGKHKLDYKQSEIDNKIAELQRKYQIGYDKNGRIKYGGASTIISKASGQQSVPRRQGEPKINMKGKSWYDPTKPEGSYIYKTADDAVYPIKKFNKDTREYTISTTDGRKKITYSVDDKDAVDRYTPVKHISDDGTVYFTDKAGTIRYKTKTSMQKSTRMNEVDNAYDLVSEARHPMEIIYADYANSMKALANRARMEMMSTGKIEYSKTAKVTYATEVKSLMDKLNDALVNANRERAAQRIANVSVANKIANNPSMSKSDIKKANQQAITRARQEVGSATRKERNIDITDREWEAIQAGAISENKLKQILDNTDIDKLRERATPRATTQLSQAKISQIKAMNASYTIQEIADKLGIPSATVSKYLKGANK